MTKTTNILYEVLSVYLSIYYAFLITLMLTIHPSDPLPPPGVRGSHSYHSMCNDTVMLEWK